MDNLWNDAESTRSGGSPLDLRVYSSRLLGREPSLVLHGGGNTSVKTTLTDLFGDTHEVLYVKGSGWDLATIEPAGFAPVRLDVLRRMADLPALSDTEMVRWQRAAMLDPGAPTPSVEAILHAIIPFAFVDHTHADAVVAVSNTPNGLERIQAIYGEDVLVVPYVMPGFILAKRVRDSTRVLDWNRCRGIILMHHGVFSFGPDARTSYQRMIELVTAAEDHLRNHRVWNGAALASSDGRPVESGDLLSLAGLRRAVARVHGRPLIARLETSTVAREYAQRPDLAAVSARGPLTPDHVIRTKPLPLVGDGDWDRAVSGYLDRYQQYFRRHAGGETQLDGAPRWVVWANRGSVGFGASVAEADIVLDIARHTARAIGWGESLGGWRALPERDLFEVEYWELEQAKLKRMAGRPPLAGKVALVTGAASGIGRAAAAALARQGASVVATDLNPAIGEIFSRPDLVGLRVDATDPAAVVASVEETIRRFGGLDIVVSNAGVFTQSQPIGSLTDAAWAASLELNLTSHMTLLRTAAPFLALGFEPSVIVMGSKNVPAPGPGAAAYSVAKAGLTQLARVAALELGKQGIRVNVLHPHAVMDTAAWTPEVLASRARAYGMTEEEYKKNNVLGVEVTTHDVANAVVALAGSAFRATTGAQIPIDGGNDRVI
jgi:rhamnose utilization protein RhaD (predicted bifunctional aldolase and dehydrogenase)/NAD(P)-dependent dehydrogenase (short-subunit alcohol dehydrogenase family)